MRKPSKKLYIALSLVQEETAFYSVVFHLSLFVGTSCHRSEMYSPVFSIEFERRRIHSPNLFYDRYFCIIVTGCVIRTEFFSAQILIIQSIRPHRRREWNGLSAGKQTTAKKEGRKELERKMCTMPRAPVYIHLSLLGEYSKEVLRILFTFKGKERKKEGKSNRGTRCCNCVAISHHHRL